MAYLSNFLCLNEYFLIDFSNIDNTDQVIVKLVQHFHKILHTFQHQKKA